MSAVALNDNSQLTYTQDVRRKIVDALMPNGKTPDDPKLIATVLKALDGHDKVTLTLKRIEAESATADADRQVLEQFHRISSMMGAKDIARTDTPMAGQGDGPATPFNADEIRTGTGEEVGVTKTGLDPVDYDEFMATQGRLHRERLENQS